jgi:hypothetical protein
MLTRLTRLSDNAVHPILMRHRASRFNVQPLNALLEKVRLPLPILTDLGWIAFDEQPIMTG